MILLSTCSAFRRASTSRPVRPGIETSVTITSGRSRLAASMSFAVSNLADDVEVVPSEQPGQTLGDDRVVAGDEDGGSAHRATNVSVCEPTRGCTRAQGCSASVLATALVDLLAGIWARTCVPSFSSETMLTVPPASLTRSVMLTRPSPLPRSSELATSNPLPSSVIVISAMSSVRRSRTSARKAPACAMTLRSAS